MFANKRSEQITFDSRSELAIGILLEKYIDNFKLIQGHTIQVNIGKDCHCDFKINDLFFEYHPINIVHELGSKFAKRFKTSLAKMSQKDARITSEKLYEQLKKEYFDRRLFLIQTTYGQNSSLIVCTNPSEVWKLIIQRFAANKVDLETFLEEFRAAQCALPLDDYSRKRFKA